MKKTAAQIAMGVLEKVALRPAPGALSTFRQFLKHTPKKMIDAKGILKYAPPKGKVMTPKKVTTLDEVDPERFLWLRGSPKDVRSVERLRSGRRDARLDRAQLQLEETRLNARILDSLREARKVVGAGMDPAIEAMEEKLR